MLDEIFDFWRKKGFVYIQFDFDFRGREPWYIICISLGGSTEDAYGAAAGSWDTAQDMLKEKWEARNDV